MKKASKEGVSAPPAMTNSERAQLREKALKSLKVHPAPWTLEPSEVADALFNVVASDGDDVGLQVFVIDAEYIAAASPQVVLGLLEELERLEAIVTAAHEWSAQYPLGERMDREIAKEIYNMCEAAEDPSQ